MKPFLIIFALFLFSCNSGQRKEKTDDNNKTENSTQSDPGNKWSNEDQVNFMNDCIQEAGRNISSDSAQKYCACVLVKAQSAYPDFKAADAKMTVEQINQWAEECLGK